jgi:hypothetical protein
MPDGSLYMPTACAVPSLPGRPLVDFPSCLFFRISGWQNHPIMYTWQIPICRTLAPLAHCVQFPSVTIATQHSTVAQKEIKKRKERKKTENRGNITLPHYFGIL